MAVICATLVNTHTHTHTHKERETDRQTDGRTDFERVYTVSSALALDRKQAVAHVNN